LRKLGWLDKNYTEKRKEVGVPPIKYKVIISNGYSRAGAHSYILTCVASGYQLQLNPFYITSVGLPKLCDIKRS